MVKEATGPLKEALVKNKKQTNKDVLDCNTCSAFLHLTNIYFQQRFLVVIFYILLTILSLGFWLMDLLVPEIQEDFCLGIWTILTEQNVIPSRTAFNYKYVGYQVFPWFLKYIFFYCFLKCIFYDYISALLLISEVLHEVFEKEKNKWRRQEETKVAQFPVIKHHLLFELQ